MVNDRVREARKFKPRFGENVRYIVLCQMEFRSRMPRAGTTGRPDRGLAPGAAVARRAAYSSAGVEGGASTRGMACAAVAAEPNAGRKICINP